MKKGLLDGAVKLVLLQFMCTTKALPSGLFEKNKESVDELIARKSGIQGVQFFEPTQNVSLLKFLEDLAEAGYTIVDAHYQMRANTRGQENPVVKFVFISEDNLRNPGEFTTHKVAATKSLEQMCSQATWSAMGYLNPFFQSGHEVDRAHSVSINLAARIPLVGPDGNPLLRWQKDEAGERIGDAPIPLEPKKFLRIQEDNICIVEE